MVLSDSDVQEIISKPPCKEVAEAVREERRARMHTESSGSITTNPAVQEFLKWVSAIIDKSKFAVFQHLMVNPLATIDVTESIFNEVRKIFDGRDRFIGYSFTRPDLVNDFRKYLQTIKDSDFWVTTAMGAIKNGYNGFIVVDMPDPEDGTITTGRPEPYYYFLPVDKVLQYEYSGNGTLEWLFFKECDDEAYLFDSINFRKFNLVQGKWVQVSIIPHNLGRVPCRQIWDDKQSNKCDFRKRGLITNSLGSLDELLFKIISASHADLYAAYPVVTMYEQRCDYTDPSGNVCEDGKVRRWVKNGHTGDNVETLEVCPKCNGGVRTLGAGTLIVAPARAKADDPDMIDAVKFVSSPIESLKYINDKVSQLKNEITYSIIGIVDEVSGVAINKDQVWSQYESRQNVLMHTKKQIEEAHKWVHETLAMLRYGKAFISCTVNYGTQFFIATSQQIMEGYKNSRDNGVPAFELALQRQQYYDTKYRSNPALLEKIKILSNIEPYQDLTIAQLLSMSTLVDQRLLKLKLDFDNYVSRFEREFVDVSLFMQYSDFNLRVNTIRDILLGYVDETQVAPQAPALPVTN